MTFGVALHIIIVLAVAILPAVAMGFAVAAKSDAYRKDEAQFPIRDAGGDVR